MTKYPYWNRGKKNGPAARGRRRGRGSCPMGEVRCPGQSGGACREAVRIARPGYRAADARPAPPRSEEHTSELQSLMRISYAVFCLKKKTINNRHTSTWKIYKKTKI